ncbi:MAG: biopolymer transporter ExbD [Bacteroidales bacterium]|jgi:biopolymer transport protein ExbD|nr:biopolymer transporter ExbD [Bacteroidales bacterium]
MAIQSRHKNKIEFNLSSQADLVFLLLIFFMITSTLVSPNAIKLLLPNSSSGKTAAPKRNFEVYIDKNLEYSILQGKDLMAINKDSLNEIIADRLAVAELAADSTDAAVVVRADTSVSIQNIVYVIDAVNRVNETQNKKHKVILATTPKK